VPRNPAAGLRRFRVTDDGLDAPDGTLMHLPEHHGVFVRSGGHWEPVRHADHLDMSSSGSRIGERWSAESEMIWTDVPELQRCEDRFRNEAGKVRYRCQRVAGHSRSKMHSDGQGGHRW
jgi:hypothetical protein